MKSTAIAAAKSVQGHHVNSICECMAVLRRARDADDITKSFRPLIKRGKLISIIALRALHRRHTMCWMVLRRNPLPKSASLGATLLTAGAKSFQDKATGAHESHEVAKWLIIFVRCGQLSKRSAGFMSFSRDSRLLYR